MRKSPRLLTTRPKFVQSGKKVVHRHTRPQIPLGRTGHGELRFGQREHRILAALDAVDDGGRPLSRLTGGMSSRRPKVTRFVLLGPRVYTPKTLRPVR